MARSPFLCFIHIERAGGTTLHHLLRYHYPTYLTLRPWMLDANHPDHVFTAGELRCLLRLFPFVKGIGGHTTRVYLGYEQVVPEVFYLTFLRDPIRRYLSHYHYHRDQKGRELSLEAFLEDRRFHNFQTVRIAGAPDLERAKRYLAERFGFVGLAEAYDASLLILRQVLGLPEVRYERRNVLLSRALSPPEEMSPALRTRLEKANALDLELYRFAREELFPRFQDLYCGNLEADLAVFREQCQSFRYHPLRRARGNLFLALFRFFFEKPLRKLCRT